MTTGSGLDGAAPPPRRATLASVASRAGVSKQTVSNVLNSPDIVAPETAARVREAVTFFGYRPHRAAQQLRTRRSRIIALRAENTIGNKVFDRFLHGVTSAASARDYRLMLYTAQDEAAEMAACDELVERWDVDGVLMTGTRPDDPRPAHPAANRSAVCHLRPPLGRRPRPPLGGCRRSRRDRFGHRTSGGGRPYPHCLHRRRVAGNLGRATRRLAKDDPAQWVSDDPSGAGPDGRATRTDGHGSVVGHAFTNGPGVFVRHLRTGGLARARSQRVAARHRCRRRRLRRHRHV